MIRTKEDYRYFIERDRIALGVLTRGVRARLRNVLFPNPIWKFQRIMRKLEYLTNVKGGGIFRLWYRWRYRRMSIKLGFSIPINTFGPGLSIAHYGPIIINPACKVGKNCRIHACVNIGASGGSMAAPQIGDNAYIGPSAVLFGDITLADNITVGANATVNKSCEEQYVVLAGSPARIVKRDCPVWWKTNGIDLS